MPRPCNHTALVKGCRICLLHFSDARYRELWSKERTEFSKKTPFDIRRCVHLGTRVLGQPCGSQLLNCNLYGDTTTQMVSCNGSNRFCGSCKSKVLPIKPFEEKPNDPAVGIVIGSFRWPSLVELQCKVIRASCGNIPILISNDDPESHDALSSICDKFSDVMLSTNSERIGHTGGDIAAFYKGIQWGADRDLDVVAKLSQRMIIHRTRWMQESALNLLRSDLPVAGKRCRGKAPFDFRTECVLMNIAEWNRPEILDRLKPRQYWNDEPLGLCAETIIFRILRDLLRGIYLPWNTILGEDRASRDYEDVLWHGNTHEDEYRSLGKHYGVEVCPDFHIKGWELELSKGTYLYG